MLKLIFQYLKKRNSAGWLRVFVLIILLSSFSATSQAPKHEADSVLVKLGFRDILNQNSLEHKIKRQEKEKRDKYVNDLSIQKQNKILNLIKLEIHNAKFLLNRGFDYKDITEEIHQLKEWEEFAVNGIDKKKFRVLTDRNLSSTSILLDEILKRTNNRLENIYSENHELGRTQGKIDSLVAEKDLYYVPADSISRENYRQQLLKLNTDINEVAARLKTAIDSIKTVEIAGDQLKYKTESDITENDQLRRSVEVRFYTEKKPVFEPLNIKELLRFDGTFPYSAKTNNLVLYFYLTNNSSSMLTMLILIIGAAVYFKLQKRKFLHLGYTKKMLIGINMLKSPIASAILVVLNLYQFVLPMPPLIFSIVIWTISTIALTVIMWKAISAFVWTVWIAIFLLNLMAMFDIINLVYVVGESYLIAVINVFGIAIGVYTFLNRAKVQRKLYLWFIVIATIIQICSLYALIEGHYNFAKFLMSKAVYTIIVVFSLYTAFLIVREVNLVSKLLNESDDDEPKSNISSVSYQPTAGFYTIILIAWFLLMTRNTYAFQSIIEPIKNAIIEPRHIGDVTYTLDNIITFFLVILLSGFISKVITFLASESQIIDKKLKAKAIGSWVFLSRIAVVTIGVMVAFASAGIPLDKITLIISALGVGIGFGMQNLINNLISGLIIAFEKPVNLDDVIEVGGQSGKMKSIGIRSSVVATYDGADLVIPNGELLEKNLKNWTLGSSTRRSEITFGVPYGTDLELIQNLLLEILTGNENVLEKPEPPRILFTNFSESGIDVEVKYWIGHFDLNADIKSELIIAFDKTLKKNNIFFRSQQHEMEEPNINSDIDSAPEPENLNN